jgi:ATP-dependent protease ClpP protease subunit
MHRGETSIYRALFTQKARKFPLLHLQTVCHTSILLNINTLDGSVQNHMAIYREMPKMLCQLKIKEKHFQRFSFIG